MKIKSNNNISSSFRDPSGFVFIQDNCIYRQINLSYKENYDGLINSGLYTELTKLKLLIPHEEINLDNVESIAYKILKPEQIPFISYPYEWCFSQLKDAALLTLEVQKKALNYGMTLKDASAYNVQFIDGKPIFIDTLSFEKYKEGQPWIAYKQFCQHFLAPLVLMAYKDIRLNQLLRIYLDGIPLDLASSLLAIKTYLKPAILTHIHLHSKSQQHYSDKPISTKTGKISKFTFLALIDNLETTIKSLKLPVLNTEWGNYYNDTNYTTDAFECKKQILEEFVNKINPLNLWDLGANTGLFSRIASNKNINTISFDVDPIAVEKNYLKVKNNKEKNIIPILIDLTNPSPGIGWENDERNSFIERGPVEMIFALALIHHLAISNNLPFEKITNFFNKICNYLVIEFVPKTDSQVKKLLATREDIFINYNQECFETQFEKTFNILVSRKIEGTERTLYLMQRKV
ncbi:MAG: hypothetical protein A2287_00780 [Candidatus Melainabacteria bacterium RIFOXYA12_FULL_32_12]|nr:MAG: hypothetical protein A2287_00780 [Candidatus Melainabacteria bacterium RIFOXYA12_FULL_32_12]